MVADNESGRGKEGMVEPVHVFDVSHFMSFREGRGEEGREGGEERRGGERRGGEGEEEKHVNFSGGVRSWPARRQVTTYTEVDFLCRGYDEFHELFSLF